MSRENVEIVRRFVEQARENPDAVWDIFDEDVEWELDPGSLALPDFPPVSRGPDGVRDCFRRLSRRCFCRGPLWEVWIMRDRKAVRVTHHVEKRDALEAAGLSE